MLIAQAERQFEWWTGARPAADVMRLAVAGAKAPALQERGATTLQSARSGVRVTESMHITTFDEFRELAQRGTFVPVYKEIVADLLTPVSAFLKIAEHSDYALAIRS